MSLSHSLAIVDALLTVLDEERAHAIVDHRRALRKPLTVHAAKLLAKQFARCADPNEGADEMIMRGWQGFKPEWIRDRNITRPNYADAARNLINGSGDVFGHSDDVQRLPVGGRRH